MQARTASVNRKTLETDIQVELTLQGSGISNITSGIGFFDHMLNTLAKHGGLDLVVQCRGDIDVDGHHSVEDIGICLGQAFSKALGDATGIKRFGNATIPMDEALVQAVVDISGRPYLACALDLPQGVYQGSYDCGLTREFFAAFAQHAGITLHIRKISGENLHHIIEAAFKAVAHALHQAVAIDRDMTGTLSTKGSLDVGKEEKK